MGKYKTSVSQPSMKPNQPPPIWRGIGCLLIIIVPILSYATAVTTLPFFIDQKIVPKELLIAPQVPGWMNFAPVLAQLLRSLIGHYAFPAIVVLTLLYIFVIGGVISIFYAYLYRMIAPSRYGPMDAPPPRIKVKKYKR